MTDKHQKVVVEMTYLEAERIHSDIFHAMMVDDSHPSLLQDYAYIGKHEIVSGASKKLFNKLDEYCNT